MHQEDRIYTSKEIKGLHCEGCLLSWLINPNLFDQPKKNSLTHFYLDEDNKVFY